MRRDGTHQDFHKQLVLTPRQRQVVELLAKGYTNGQIAAALGITLDGAKWHVSEIIGKFDVSSREQAVDQWRTYNSPAARFSRAFHSLAPLAVFKWAAGGAAALAVGAGALVVIVAVANNSGSTGEPPLAGTATPTAAETPVAVTATPTVVETPAPTQTPEPVEQMALTVYLMRGEKVGPVQRLVPQTQAVGRAAMEQLLSGASLAEADAGMVSAIPAGTRLLGLTISDGVATVDLSAEFDTGGGSLSMQARVAQVVYTLTQFPTVDAVEFQLEGEPLEVLGGEGVILDRPATREDYEDLTPSILVDSPPLGASIQSPVVVSGTANTFEAMFQLQILDGEGNVLADLPVMATSGSGERGTFEVSVPFEIAESGAGMIVVFEPSAEDGSPLHQVEVPVTLDVEP